MRSLHSDLAFRGLIVQMSDPGLATGLNDGALVAYAGFDPSTDSLHVGHLLGLLYLRRLQQGGHKAIALLGAGTGLIGDPGGKAEERPMLSMDELQANAIAIRSQMERFIDLEGAAGRASAIVIDNRDWLASMGLIEFLRDVGKHFTVNQMIAKESVRARLEEREHGISFTEFSYMLLQAYDYLHLFDAYGCRLQLGGSDQWGNITMGVDLIRRKRGEQAYALTWPLVVRSDGTKMGKTASGAVWLDAHRTSPYQLFQYFVRTDDSQVGSFLRYFTFLDPERIEELQAAAAGQPEEREAQRALAREVVAMVHGAAEASKAERAAAALFGADLEGLDEATLRDMFADAPSTTFAATELDGEGLALVDALVSTGLERSRSSARKTIAQGGAYVNNRRESDPDRRLAAKDVIGGRIVVLRKGRKNYHLACFA